MQHSARSARVRAAPIAGILLLLAGQLFHADRAAAAPASQRAAAYADAVAEASLRFGIPEAWIWRVMHAESRGNPRAVSRVGAMGLMQIMPATWAMLTARHRLGSNPFGVRANIHAGAAYLRAMWDRYGDLRLMLAAYNAGPGRVDAYAAGRRGLPAETVAYVAAIAPAIGASSVASLAPAPTQAAPGWRSAPLFSEQPQRVEESAAAAASLQTGRETPATRSPVERQASPLFVPLSGRDR